MRLVALITTVYVVLEVVLKLQFIVSLVTSTLPVFGLIPTVTLSVEGMYTDDEFPYCNTMVIYNKPGQFIRTGIITSWNGDNAPVGMYCTVAAVSHHSFFKALQ